MAVNRKIAGFFSFAEFTLKRYGHTWTSITTVFNSIKPTDFYSRYTSERKGLFGIPTLTSPSSFINLKDECEAAANRLVEEAISPIRQRNLTVIFDEISDNLRKIANLSEFIRHSQSENEYIRFAEEASSNVNEIVVKFNTDYKLYAILKDVVEKGDIMPTDVMDEYVARLFLQDFEQSGIYLPDDKRLQIVNLNSMISSVEQSFSVGVSSPRHLEKSSLESEIQKFYPGEGNTVVVRDLDALADNATIREFAYKAYLLPEQNQEFLLTQLLENRNKLAKICGFSTYSQRALAGSLAEDPTTVMNFINHLSSAIKPRAQQDYKTMLNVKSAIEGSAAKHLNAWDINYYRHKVRLNTFKQGDDAYKQFFSLGTCMEGLNRLFYALFETSLVPTELAQGEAWHPQVYKLSVMHKTEGLLGYIYCDMYSRKNKPAQDRHFMIQGGRQSSDGNHQLPIVTLLFNFPPPNVSKPSLLTLSMVSSLFHQMGYAMQSMLARNKFQHVIGARCWTDLTEVPSILMEYFASDPRVLRTFARHYLTGDLMPEDMIAGISASKNLFEASDMQLQLFYSALDQAYHGEPTKDTTTTSTLESIQDDYYGIPYVQNTAWQLRFNHLVSHGAKYYAHIMSKAVACWIWQTYFQRDPFNRASGYKYRNDFLHFAGGKPPRLLVRDFLQKDFALSTLVASLIKETDEKNKTVRLFQDKS